MKFPILVLAGLAILTGLIANARISYAERGVGVNLGQIKIEDRLSPGGGYSLPALGVINTGDKYGDYEVVITYLEGQKESRPPEAWFNFNPNRFSLAAGDGQTVEIRLELPTGADPGDYFAFVEAHPLAENSGPSIGLAAATKLSFSVKPSNWFEVQAIRFNRYIDDSQPWSYVIPFAILVVLLLLLARRFFRVGLRVERR